MAWIPKYIRDFVDYRSKQEVTAPEWNARWNLTIEQGNYNTDAILQIFGSMLSEEQILQMIKDHMSTSGSGDMAKVVYDVNNHGYVDKAAFADDLSNGKLTALQTDISNRYTKSESDAKYGTKTDLNTVQTKVTNLNTKLITFTGIIAATTGWVADSTYSGFPYKYALPCPGCLVTDIPKVCFAPAQQESGMFIGANSAADVVNIYASSIPTANISIPLVMLFRVVV